MEKELELQSVSQQENVSDNVDYIEAIKEMKLNTVDKGAYEKLKAENKKLLQSLVNGEELAATAVKEAQVDVSDLRKKLFTPDNDMSNLEYITTALKLRDELISKGEPDPFLPVGEKILPTDEDIELANRVANCLKDCVDYADGDSRIFTSELQRIMVDTSPARRR